MNNHCISQKKLSGTIPQVIRTGGGTGTGDHRDLSNRDAANQHPISAITGLEEALASKTNGYTFTPSVSPEGVISWSNNGNLPNPDPVNIKGPQGAQGNTGPQGTDGKSATVSVGKVTTSEPGTDAQITNIGTENTAVFDFVIPRGETGPKGDTGERGPIGETGPQGLQGERGETGPAGPQGIPGEKGETGKGFKVIDYYDSLELLQQNVPSPEPGDAYGVGYFEPYDIYIYGETAGWVNNGPLQGAQGPDGKAATITVGTVSTGEPGTQVSVTNSGTSTDAILNFTIPRGEKGLKGDTGPEGPKGETGEKGDTGPEGPQGEPGAKGDPGAAGKSATIQIGVVSATEPGGNPTVQNVGTSTDAVFNFTFPRGEQGEKGEKGDTGDTGPRGPAGQDGAQGPSGERGPEGPAGKNGVTPVITVKATTLEAGSEATVSKSGSDEAPTFTFGIPKGATGGGVTSFNGRGGAVNPQAGDYTADMVGTYTSAEIDEKLGNVTVDLSGYATEEWVNSQGFLTAIPQEYATQTWVQQQGYLTDVPDEYVTADELTAELTDYATKDYVSGLGYITSAALNGYATQAWVVEQGYLTSGALSGYATQTWVEGRGYLTAVPAEYVTDTELTAKGYATTADVAETYAEKGFTWTGTLTAAGWSGSAAPYTQTLAISGMQATDNPFLGPNYTSTDVDTVKGQEEAFSLIGRIDSGVGNITVYIYEDSKPEVDIPILVKVVR